nr:hypothetical protein [Rikenellaceae bacterium]
MNIAQLELAKKTFNLQLIEDNVRKNIGLRKKFVNYFTPNKISSMDINEYVIGVQNKESFCYYLEYTLYELGSISGQPSNKYGVWFSPSKKQYCFENRFGNNYKEAFKKVRIALLKLIQDGAKRDYESIIKNPLNSLVKAKVLAMYYPDKYMNVYSRPHLDYYLTTLGLNTPKLMRADVLYKREALIDFKNEDKDMQTWSNYVFSIFLWSHYPKDPRHLTPVFDTSSLFKEQNKELKC